MNAVNSYIIGIASGVTISVLYKCIIAIWDRLFRDLPSVSGKWTTHYSFKENGGSTVEAHESATVKKIGRWVSAEARMTGSHDRIWALKGEIRGRYWSGKVYAGDRHTLSGSGVFQLKIWEHGRRMEGYMAWWDSELDEIFITDYKWKKEVTEKTYR